MVLIGAMKVIVYEGQGQPMAGADKCRVVTASELAAADVVLTTYEVSSRDIFKPARNLAMFIFSFSVILIVCSHPAPNSYLICRNASDVQICHGTVCRHASTHLCGHWCIVVFTYQAHSRPLCFCMPTVFAPAQVLRQDVHRQPDTTAGSDRSLRNWKKYQVLCARLISFSLSVMRTP